MQSELILVVSLWVEDANVERFEAFERDAVRRMARYGGRLERAVRVDDRTSPDQPFEIHVVTFPNESAFVAYQEDPETKRAADLRSQVIVESRVAVGRNVGAYGQVPPVPDGDA